MEKKVIVYLKRISTTISIMLVWMIINTKLGITNNYAFFSEKPRTANYIFYSWFIISLVAMLIFFYNVWKKDVGFDEE